MTRQELRVVMQEWFCGCGSPESACARLRDLLAIHPLFDHREEFERLVPDEGFQYLLLYMLDRLELTEHGGSVGGAWLTAKGQGVLEALNTEAADHINALNDGCCIHGYSVETEHCTKGCDF